jgi:hypothetical protein
MLQKKFRDLTYPGKYGANEIVVEPAMANAIICCFTGTFVKTPLVNVVQKKKLSNTLWKNVPLLLKTP